MTKVADKSTAALVAVPFRGGSIVATQNERGVWAPIKRVCEALGLAEQPQAAKLKNKPWAVTTMIVATGPDGKSYEMRCIHLDALPMWLATVEASKVSAKARPTLVAYQCEAADVLRDHFLPKLADVEAQGKIIALTLEVEALRFGRKHVIGAKNARIHITGPLREAARHLCIAEGDVKMFRSALLKLDSALRFHLGYLRDTRQTWAELPISLLSKANMMVNKQLGEAEQKSAHMRELAHAAAKAAQTSIFERVVGSDVTLEGDAAAE